MLRAKRNRRRVDVTKASQELKATVKARAPWVLKVLATASLSVGLVLGSVHGWRWACKSPRFALSEVQLQGAERVTEAEVRRLGGVLPGQNVLALDITELERAVARHPWVKKVTVRRRLPQTLLVTVAEHEPVAMVSLGELYLVGVDGVPFKRLAAQDQADVPLVTGLEREALAERSEQAVARLKQGLEVADAYSRSLAAKGHPLSELALTSSGVSLVTTSGQRLDFGEGEVAQKLERLRSVRRELDKRTLTASVIRLDNRRRAGWVTVELNEAKP